MGERRRFYIDFFGNKAAQEAETKLNQQGITTTDGTVEGKTNPRTLMSKVKGAGLHQTELIPGSHNGVPHQSGTLKNENNETVAQFTLFGKRPKKRKGQ